MNLRRAPYLKVGAERRREKYEARMVHSGYGVDDFPDGHLGRIAHAGFGDILFYVDRIDVTRAGKTGIAALIDAAEAWGLGSYLYSALKANVHPDDPGSEAVFDGSFGAVGRAYPKAKGIILVPESCDFPSRDPRAKTISRWFPTSDYPLWSAAVEKAFRKGNPDGEVIFWTYNFCWYEDADRCAFIRRVTPTTAINLTFAVGGDRRMHRARTGYDFTIEDYSICEPGPSPLFGPEAQAVKERGLRLFTMANTAGRTWDFGCCPYEPVPQAWKRRFDAIEQARKDYPLVGLMETHHYGFAPNFIAELAKEVFVEGGLPFDRHLRAIAARDFGEAHADEVVAAWDEMSEAIRDYVATGENQYGPFRVGPAFPFNCYGKPIKPTDIPGWNGWICNPNYGWDIPWSGGESKPAKLDVERHRHEIRLFRPAGERFVAAAAKLRRFAEELPGDRRVRALREAGVAEYIGRSFLTCANVKEATLAERDGDRATVLRLARDEYENAKAALPLVDFDSRLGWEPSMRYRGARPQIEWKLRRMEELYGLSPLEAGFRAPPMSARPQAWWHWMNGNVSKSGITEDLEAMKEMGLGGATLFDAGCGVPPGPGPAFASPGWYETVRHATDEAARLELEIITPTCSGWSSSGGPWVRPEDGMKVLCHTEARVKGPGKTAVKLPPLPDPHGHCGDIAVLAVPVPPAESRTMARAGATVSTPEPDVTLISFPEPYEAAGVEYRLEHPWCWEIDGEVVVSASDDGRDFTEICRADANVTRRADEDKSLRYEPFPRLVSARYFRIAFRFTTESADPNDAHLIREVKAVDVAVTRRAAIANLADKTLRKRVPVTHAYAAPADAVVARTEVRDVTSSFGVDGVLRWDVPAGEWRIIRLGYAVNGKRNHPASDHGEGPEVDKLSSAAVARHFDSYSAKLEGVRGFLVDSYEIGCQNWTPGFAEEFRRRRGYDMGPYLPVLAGVVVGSTDESERFLWDFRRTVADLFAEGYSGTLARKCHERGLTLSLEPYGNCPCDDLEYGEHADIPMGEFWSKAESGNRFTDVGNAKLPSYLAHVWGRRFVGAEAFTTASGRWRTTPFALKAQGDRAFARGVNRLIFHCSAHQPWTEPGRKPGATLGPYGLYLNRANTWWTCARPWMDYLSRCQWMLQEGTFVADVLFWHGEEAPSRGGHLVKLPEDFRDTPVPAGYDRDVCSTRALHRLRVEDGRIVAPGGTRYRLLVLQDTDEMSPETLETVRRLVEAGARVAAPRKPVRTPGLGGGPDGDSRLRAAADTVWAKGVIRGGAAEGLAALDVAPDFICRSAPEGLAGETAWIHRRTDDGVETYFVACPNEKAGTFTCSFRVDGLEPELWDAETGRTGLKPCAWRREGGRTEVTFELPPSGSTFVVFRRRTSARTGGQAAAVTRTEMPLSPKWQVTFPVGWYTGEETVRTVSLPDLVDWTTLDDPELKYFSGTATYVAHVAVPESARVAGGRVFLDLGAVREFAEVTVNGRRFPALWRPPYRVDVTEAVTASRELDVSVRVTNLWPNRLIGDDRLCAPDCEWDGVRNCGLKAIPSWVTEGRQSPTGRKTFSTWRHWTKDDELLPSGLLGPVRLTVEEAR